MRKIRPIFHYCFLLISLALVGCGQANVTQTGTALTAAVPVESSPTAKALETPTPTALPTSVFAEPGKALGGVRVHLWHALTGDAAIKLDELATDFNRTNSWGIWVEVSGYPDETGLETALKNVWGSADQPDVLVVAPERASALDAERENLVDLAPYVSDAEWGVTKAEQDDYLATFWAQESDGAQRWGIPALGSMQVMFYNQTWGEELGYSSLPSTTSDFKTQACSAAVQIMNDRTTDNDGTGGWMVDLDPLTVTSWIQAFGGEVKADASGQYRFNNASTQAAFEYLKSAYDNGCFWYPRKSDPSGYFADREALAVAGNIELGATLTDRMASAGNQDTWTVFPFPGEGGASDVTLTSLSYHILKATPEEQLAAWSVIKWLSQADVMNQLAESGWRLPVRSSALEALQNDATQPAALKAAAALLVDGQMAPQGTGWETAQPVLQDAYRQIFQADTTVAGIPTILTDLDQMIAELEGRSE